MASSRTIPKAVLRWIRANGKSVGELRVAGIVSEAPKPRLETVVDEAGRPLVGDDGKPMAYFPENQGLIPS